MGILVRLLIGIGKYVREMQSITAYGILKPWYWATILFMKIFFSARAGVIAIISSHYGLYVHRGGLV